MSKPLVMHGDCLNVLTDLPDAGIDVVITDPPYGLSDLTPAQVGAALVAWAGGDRGRVPDARGFMGSDWDAFVPPPAVFDQLLRVLKPGGHMAVFAGARTQDIMGVSLRLAGFEIRDTVMWLYGHGMPKSVRLEQGFGKRGDEANARRFAGYAATLKPAYEPIIIARKPLQRTILDNASEFGTGAVNVAGAAVPFVSDRDAAEAAGKNRHATWGTLPGGNRVFGDFTMVASRKDYNAPGRWPSNVVLDQDAAHAVDDAGPFNARAGAGASRFFYCARASSRERPVGADGSGHVTVKPLALMSWLVTLLAPPGRARILDPFAGSGTTGEAAVLAGHDAILIEREEKYVPLILQRLRRAV